MDPIELEPLEGLHSMTETLKYERIHILWYNRAGQKSILKLYQGITGK